MAGRHLLKKIMFRVHKAGVQMGVHILPVHYYSPIPNIIELESTREAWSKPSELPGIEVNLDQQVANLREFCLPYQGEYVGNRIYREGVSSHMGPGYGYIEAQALHSFVRHYKPKRIIEVGSGVSTYCMRAASDMNVKEMGQGSEVTSIEPYPSAALRQLAKIELIPQKVQVVPLETFSKLGEGDLLFIDSSHTVKAGGDVNFLFLEVLPRLKPGVFVHIHDIYFPYDYPRDVLRTFLFGQETSLLRAYLIHNHRISIVACLSHLHYERTAALREIFPDYKPQEQDDGMRVGDGMVYTDPRHFPSSIYLRTQLG